MRVLFWVGGGSIGRRKAVRAHCERRSGVPTLLAKRETALLTEKVIRPMNAKWRQRAACQGLDPDIFYPVSEDDADEAKAICGTCPVRAVCLEHALANRERDGIWGGMTDRERRRLVRQRRKSA